MKLLAWVLRVAYVALSVRAAVAVYAMADIRGPWSIAIAILAPLTVVALMAAGIGVGFLWSIGLTDRDPEDYSQGCYLAVAVVAAAVNAVGYLWLISRYQRRRRCRHETDIASQAYVG